MQRIFVLSSTFSHSRIFVILCIAGDLCYSAKYYRRLRKTERLLETKESGSEKTPQLTTTIIVVCVCVWQQQSYNDALNCNEVTLNL